MGSGYRTFTAGEVLTASNVQDYLMDQSVMVFADSTARATNIGTANFEEGMVSYLEDSDTVEVYDGSAWASIAPASTSGLTLINTTSFSGVASQAVNDVFSATYDNYRFILDITDLTSDSSVNMKLRVSATDDSTNYYTMLNGVRSDGSTSAITQNNLTTGLFMLSGDAGTDNIYGYTGDLLKPFLAINTKVVGISHSSTSTGIPASISGGGLHLVATSYTGINLIASAGNMTGSIKIYGYNN